VRVGEVMLAYDVSGTVLWEYTAERPFDDLVITTDSTLSYSTHGDSMAILTELVLRRRSCALRWNVAGPQGYDALQQSIDMRDVESLLTIHDLRGRVVGIEPERSGQLTAAGYYLLVDRSSRAASSRGGVKKAERRLNSR